MDHSSKLNPYTIIAQSESAIKNITQCNGELQQLKKSVLSFADDSYIKSDAFDMLKEYADEIPGLIDRIIECNESDIGDYRTLASSVGDEVLIGSIILDNKNRYYRLWWDATQKADMYRAKAQSAINPSMQNVLQGLANYYSELATQYHSLFVYWRTKEEKYDEIERITSGLFDNNSIVANDFAQLFDDCLDKIKIGSGYIRLGSICYNIKNETRVIIDEMLPFNDGVMIAPKPGDKIDVWYGIDEPDRKYTTEVSLYNMWSIEYSMNGCDKAFPNSLASRRLHYAIDNYGSNNGEEDLLIFDVDKIDGPLYAGAMIAGFANVGDIVEISLDNDSTFYFLILDVKNNKHKGTELYPGQIQCEWGHGGIIKDNKTQLSICEFITAGGKYNSALDTKSGNQLLKDRYITEAHIVEHIYIED